MLPGAQEPDPYSNYELRLATWGHWAKETEKQISHSATSFGRVFRDLWNNKVHEGSGVLLLEEEEVPTNWLSPSFAFQKQNTQNT